MSFAHSPGIQTWSDEGRFMNRYLILGIISMLGALVLSCVAGMYAAINLNVAIATACTAYLALMVGVKCLAGSR